MIKIIDKLIDDIIELILDDMDCRHEVDHDEGGVHTSVDYSLNSETKLRWKMGELIEQARESALIKEQEKAKLIWDATCPGIAATWLPTAENINALPEPVRNYIAGLQTNADPPSMVADNIIMKDTIKTLEKMLEEFPEITEEWADKKAKEIWNLVQDGQDEDLSDPVTAVHYLGLSLDIVTSIIDDLRPKK